MNKFFAGSVSAYILSWLITSTIAGAFCFVLQFYLDNLLVIIPALIFAPFAAIAILIANPLLLLLVLISALIHVTALEIIQKRANLRPRTISILIGGFVGLIQFSLSPLFWNAPSYIIKHSALLILGVPMLCGCLCSGLILGRVYEEADFEP